MQRASVAPSRDMPAFTKTSSTSPALTALIRPAPSESDKAERTSSAPGSSNRKASTAELSNTFTMPVGPPLFCLRFAATVDNGSRVVSLPSKEATVRGFSGASLIIEDEASRVEDQLYRTMRPMLAVSRGRLILMSTPYGKQGHFFEEWTNGGSDWERIEVRATDCPRISPLFLDEEHRSLGERWFRQEYLCEFAETVDRVFSYETVMKALSPDVKTLF